MKSIEITDALIDLIKTERARKGLSGIKLSEKIGKSSNNYISLLESRKIKKIKRIDLIKILIILLDMTGEEAEQYIESMTNPQEIDHTKNLTFFEPEDLQTDDEREFNKFNKNFENLFRIAFNQNSEYTLKSMKRFNANLKSDLGFMLSLIRLPYFALKDIDIEIKKQLFDETATTLKKYLEKYEPKKDSEE